MTSSSPLEPSKVEWGQLEKVVRKTERGQILQGEPTPGLWVSAQLVQEEKQRGWVVCRGVKFKVVHQRAGAALEPCLGIEGRCWPLSPSASQFFFSKETEELN